MSCRVSSFILLTAVVVQWLGALAIDSNKWSTNPSSFSLIIVASFEPSETNVDSITTSQGVVKREKTGKALGPIPNTQ